MCGRWEDDDDDDDDGICTSNTCIMNKVANDDRELMFQDYSDYIWGSGCLGFAKRCKNKVRKPCVTVCFACGRGGGRAAKGVEAGNLCMPYV